MRGAEKNSVWMQWMSGAEKKIVWMDERRRENSVWMDV